MWRPTSAFGLRWSNGFSQYAPSSASGRETWRRLFNISMQRHAPSVAGHRQRWKPDDDDLLLKLRHEGSTLDEMAAHFPQRTLRAVEHRLYIKLRSRWTILRAAVSKRWAQREDRSLQALRGSGLGWAEMQKAHFPDRTADQLRKHYNGVLQLDPYRKRGDFSAQEGSEIARLREVERHTWSTVATLSLIHI